MAHDATEQLSIHGSTLDTLRSEAVALVPARHWDGDVAWVETTEQLTYSASARSLTPAQLAKAVTESLDEAATDWAVEVARDSIEEGRS